MSSFGPPVSSTPAPSSFGPAATAPFSAPVSAPISTVPTVPARVSSVASGFGTRVSSGARSAYQYVTGQGLTTLMVVVVAVGVFAALAYTVYQILSTNLKVVTLLEEPLHAISQAKSVSSDKFPTMKNGKEFSLSFWVYVETQMNTQGLKSVFHIGDDENSKSPVVVMDRSTNKLYVALRTSEVTDGTTSTGVLSSYAQQRLPQSGASSSATNTGANESTGLEDFQYQGFVILEIEYVPLARWVNLVIVLDNDMVTLYLDGDIYSVVPVTRFAKSGVVMDPEGSLAVGSATTGFSGYVSNVQIANYAFSVFHSRAIYRAGPVRRSLGWLLPSNLKLQWPIATVKTDE